MTENTEADRISDTQMPNLTSNKGIKKLRIIISSTALWTKKNMKKPKRKEAFQLTGESFKTCPMNRIKKPKMIIAAPIK